MERVMILATPQEIAEALILFMEKYKNPENRPAVIIPEKMDRRTAAKYLGVSYTTMYNWLKDGVLTEHGHARKRYFLRSELNSAMQKIL